MPEAQMVEQLATQLREAGYPLVEVQPQRPGSRRVPDLVAYAADDDGELRPYLVAEVKQFTDPKSEALALGALAGFASELGTRVNLLVLGGQWREADSGFTQSSRLDGPPAAPKRPGRLSDESVLERLLAQTLRQSLSADQDSTAPDFHWRLIQWRNNLVHGVDGPPVDVAYDAFLKSMAEVTLSGPGRGRGDSVSAPDVVGAMSALAQPCPPGGLIADPFVGSGLGLVVAARDAGPDVRVWGRDVNVTALELARTAVTEMGLLGDVVQGDSFSEPVPVANTIVTTPPWGLRDLRVPSPAGDLRDSVAAAIAVCAQALAPGGRAVILTNRSWTFSSQARALRSWLAREFHVAALIALPADHVVSGAARLLVVIDRAEPGPTFIASLEHDWREHLTPGSQLLQEFSQAAPRVHL